MNSQVAEAHASTTAIADAEAVDADQAGPRDVAQR